MTGRFAGERVVVVGAGVAGAGRAEVLVAEGARSRVTEERRGAALSDAAARLRGSGSSCSPAGHEPAHLDGATLVVAEPGRARARAGPRLGARARHPVWGEMELGARSAHAPYVAVTGTNGKTTTTGMLAACLRAAGLDAVACGNIGHPFPTAAREGHDALVVECSSFQLALQTSFHPRVSVLLNLAPDHLDWHGSFEAYAAAKARIFAPAGRGRRPRGQPRRRRRRDGSRRAAPCPVDVVHARDAGARRGRVSRATS